MTGVSLLIWLTLEQLVDLPEWSTISDVGDDHGGGCCTSFRFSFVLFAVYLLGRTGELNLTGRNSLRGVLGVAGKDWQPPFSFTVQPLVKAGCGGGGGGIGIGAVVSWTAGLESWLVFESSKRLGVLDALGDQIPGMDDFKLEMRGDFKLHFTVISSNERWSFLRFYFCKISQK